MFIYCICTQYLVGAPFTLITASIRRGMEVISLWHCWGGMEAQVSLTVAFSSSALLGLVSLHLLYFLRKLRRARAPTPIMCTFYRGTIESILTSCITVWYGTCNASCRKSLQRIVRAAEKIIGVSLPSLQDIYSTRLTRKDLCIAGDPTHPSHSFFSLLPSGRRLRSLQARTSRLKDSFIHQAVRKLNSLPSLPPTPSFTPRNTELWHYDRPPPPQLPTSPHPHIPRPPPPPLTNCDPHQSLCAALDWSLPHPALTVNYLFWQSDKRLFFFCTTHISAQFCFI